MRRKRLTERDNQIPEQPTYNTETAAESALMAVAVVAVCVVGFLLLAGGGVPASVNV